MTTADIFNVGRVITDPADPTGKKTFALRKPDQYEQGEFQRWLEQCAHDAVDRSNASEEAKDRRHHLIDVEAGLGKYMYEGEYGYLARFTPAGMVKLTEIVLRSQGMDGDKAEEIVRHRFKEAAAEFIGRKITDPKQFALVLAALGLPSEWMPSTASGPSYNSCSTHPSAEPTPNSGDAPTINSSSSSTLNEGTTG